MFLPICTAWLRYLHSTMFLLIRWKHWLTGARTSTFTFHNVSINTDTQKFAFLFEFEFTFHNVSINTIVIHQMSIHISYLHSTMFLLILSLRRITMWWNIHLHSTMFLLIPRKRTYCICILQIYIPQCFY